MASLLARGAAAVPNGTSTTAAYTVYNNSTPANGTIGALVATATDVRVTSTPLGGSQLPIKLILNTTQALSCETNSDVVVGAASAALATNATGGWLWVTTSAGAPTGTPSGSYTGIAPIHIDTTNGRLYTRYGGAWHYAALT